MKKNEDEKNELLIQAWYEFDFYTIGKLKDRRAQKYILDESVTKRTMYDLWFYSPIKKRSIQIKESNLEHLLVTEIALFNEIDSNEFLEFVSELPEVDSITDQTILYLDLDFIVNVFTLPVYYSNPNSMKNSTRAWIMLQLKKLQLAKKINLVSELYSCTTVFLPVYFILRS